MKHDFRDSWPRARSRRCFPAGAARAQVTVAAGYTPPDDTPTVNVGGTIFADYTYMQEPTVNGSDGQPGPSNAFNVTRAYINVTGQINHLIAVPHHARRRARRPGPRRRGRPGHHRDADVPSQVRLRTAELQRLHDQGLVVPARTAADALHRLRRGHLPLPVRRHRCSRTAKAFLTSSDLGASVHWNVPGNFGDIHARRVQRRRATRPSRTTTPDGVPGARNAAPASHGPDHQGPAPDGLLRRRPLR